MQKVWGGAVLGVAVLALAGCSVVGAVTQPLQPKTMPNSTSLVVDLTSYYPTLSQGMTWTYHVTAGQDVLDETTTVTGVSNGLSCKTTASGYGDLVEHQGAGVGSRTFQSQGNESVTVPAGTFQCVKYKDPMNPDTIWVASNVGIVKREEANFTPAHTFQLTGFSK